DTALKTANSGYLTRRLVDVSQDVIVREEHCGTRRGLSVTIAEPNDNGELVLVDDVETSAYSRVLVTDVEDADDKVVGYAGEDVGSTKLDELLASGVTDIRVRSVLTCDSRVGTCAKCYGRSMATGKVVDIGEAVGIIAAQSIGEPGTQL